MRKILIGTFFMILCFLTATPALAASSHSDEGVYVACKVCGLCPAPFGICVFYYIIVVLVILIAIVLFRNRSKKCPLCKTKSPRNAQICSKCGYDFTSGLQSTLSIRVEDSPELMALRNTKNASAEPNDIHSEDSIQESAYQTPAAQASVPDSAKEFAFEVIQSTPAALSASEKNDANLIKAEPYKAPPAAPAANIPDSLISGDTVPIVLDTFKKRPAKFSPLEEAPAPKPKEQPIPEPEPPDLPASVEKYMINTEDPITPAPASPQPPANKSCPFCGAELHPKALFCGKCGKKLA